MKPTDEALRDVRKYMDEKHVWVPSPLGHGNKMCSRCFVTDLEAAAIGMLTCEVKETK